MTTVAHGRRVGFTLLALVPVLVLLSVGLAFTFFGEAAALLAVVSLVAGSAALVRARRAR
ncbi:MAG: hypothetical protein ACYDAQ_11160 [Mycobacteriales bacterium]